MLISRVFPNRTKTEAVFETEKEDEGDMLDQLFMCFLGLAGSRNDSGRE